ncbi:MAG: glycosyltransferase family 4 protein [Verrucomicrobia subdivision 3 bacterium]|nr:glycosyltransferase family 4 protein [Limisphaerales bacterium]
MKLLFAHDRFGSFGGAESNIAATAEALRARGHTLAILHGPRTHQGEARWRSTFHHCFEVPTGKPSRGKRRESESGDRSLDSKLETVQRVLWSFEPDSIYVHKLSDLETLTALLGSGIPTVRMVHDHDLYCMRSYKYDWLSRRICTRSASIYCVLRCGACLCRDRTRLWPFRWVSYRAKRKEIALNRQFDRLVVASEYMRQELLRNGFAPEQIEIHPPVPRQALQGPIVQSTSTRNLIIYSGQIIRGKGVDVLLRALAKVRARFECLIFGDGNHRASCESLAQRLGLCDRVRFAGFVPQEELNRQFSEATVAVMGSVWPEPFGASGLEALRLGVPVVAFDAGAIKEWLIDGVNGYLVPWMDTTTFAARLDKLLDDRALARQLGENGRTLVNAQYEFDRYVSALEDLFGRVSQAREAAA